MKREPSKDGKDSASKPKADRIEPRMDRNDPKADGNVPKADRNDSQRDRIEPKADHNHPQVTPNHPQAKLNDLKGKPNEPPAKPNHPQADPVPAKPVAGSAEASAGASDAGAASEPGPPPVPMDAAAVRAALCERFGPLFRLLRQGAGLSQEAITDPTFPRSTLRGMEANAAGTGLWTMRTGAGVLHMDLWVVVLLAEVCARVRAAMPFTEPLTPGNVRCLLGAALRHAMRALRTGLPLDSLLSNFWATDGVDFGGLPPGGMPPVT